MTLAGLLSLPAPIPEGIGRVHRCLGDDDDEDQKQCIKCGEWKPLEDFYYRQTRGTYSGDCRTCHCARMKANVQKRKAPR